jgi:formylmethanofuran dehydrogenase subunit B
MKQITDVACTVCGCVCDDLTITVENNRITLAEKACVLAEPWFLSQNAVRPPIAQIDGKTVSLDDALDRAAEILRQSRSPLIYGLSRSTTEGQRAAVALAERLGATIDTTATTGHAPSLMALQQVGESTCTLGEVKNRADLVVYWATDPLVSHPRHLERYAVDPTGMFVPNGRADRFVVAVANAENETTKRADLFLRIEPDKDWESLWTLRGLLKGIEPASPAGAPLDELRLLAERMKSCRCGIVFFGAGLTRSGLGHRNVEALLQLVIELNAFTRFYARRMRRLGDVAGADSVLTWQTGYPFAVNFALGYPRYNPGEFSAPEMLARGEIDACVFVGSETSVEFPTAAAECLRRIPIVALESPGTQLAFPAAVQFTTAVYGVHRPGTAYRMDEVPIPLRVLLETDYPSDGEILSGLLRRLLGTGS